MTKGVLFLWVVCCFSSRRRNKQALFPSSAVWVNQKVRRTGSGPFPSPQVQPAPDATLGINLSHKEQSSHPPLPEVGKEEVFRDGELWLKSCRWESTTIFHLLLRVDLKSSSAPNLPQLTSSRHAGSARQLGSPTPALLHTGVLINNG